MCPHKRIRLSLYIKNKREGYIIKCIDCNTVLKDCDNSEEIDKYIKDNDIKYIDNWIKGLDYNVREKRSSEY